MGQTWTTDCFAGSHEVQTDMANMEVNFATLKSLFSGATAPSNTVAGMPWFDTAKKVLKVRDSADSAWVGLMHGDTSQKMWVYRNSAMNGWAVDSAAGIQDKVLAVKGGTTYTAGAATAGSWTISGLTIDDHNHDLPIGFTGAFAVYVANYGSTKTWAYKEAAALQAASDTHNMFASYDASLTIAADGAHRPAAAVGTLQYLDL